MKKKTIILLTASFLGFSLVGGTLAGWAVTDNAAEFDIKVSPGTISGDTTTKYVTMAWGSSQQMGDVGQLKRDTVRKAGVLDLRALHDTSSNIYGRLRYRLNGSAELQAKLNLEIYKGDIPAANDLITAETYDAAETYAVNDLVKKGSDYLKCTTAISTPEPFNEAHWTTYAKQTFATEKLDVDGKDSASGTPTGYEYVDVAAIKNDANLFTVLVYLSPLTNTEYEALSSATVNIYFDWGISAVEDKVDTKVFYVSGLTPTVAGGNKIYAYAYKGDDVNSAWPGVEMDPVVSEIDGLYSVAIDTAAYDYIIFDNGNYDGHTETLSLKISEVFTGTKNYYAYSNNPEVETYDPTATKMYYIVGTGLSVGGTPLSWSTSDAGKLTLNAGEAEVTVTTDGGAAFKVYESLNGKWFGESDSKTGDVALGDAGTYIITFNPTGPTYIVCAKQ